ncbi:hypothetical protein DPX16_19370 [Anabarilius grahami]|uniref:Uncharacterized protein n=1 Tax=Anabarilius grahami TaxID=495550 RepID=A0A3N0Z0P5_ANAGA|nr:hypothetical protein DPX16_19370 [Anabarilius grahami]
MSTLPSEINQIKASHEANIGFGRALMPSYLGMHVKTSISDRKYPTWDSVPSPHSLATDGTRAVNLTEHGQKRVEGEMDVEWAGPQMCYGGPKGLLGNEIPISL